MLIYLRLKHYLMRFFILSCLLCLAIAVSAQVPGLIPYQAIARDAAGQPLASANINARFTMHDATPSGAVVWQEIQTVTTTPLGLFTVQLGSTVPLTAVNWASASKFIQVEVDFGSGFTDVGTQQMLSVPYALYAGNGIERVSEFGDTLFLGGGNYYIINGISQTNGFNQSVANGRTSCGAPNVLNTSISYGEITDVEGNAYKTVNIAGVEWMAENLRTRHYANGDLIPLHPVQLNWYNTLEGACAWYGGDSLTYACPYGGLYNHYAILDPRGVCPVGWHVPSDADWSQLNIVAGGNSAGAHLKSEGTLYWTPPNTGALNSLGFSALPSGMRHFTGTSAYIGESAYYWSSDLYGESDAFGMIASFDNRYFGIINADRNYGYAVRCVRD
jgi:uncharacterized protein (TIGR02145 family)